MTDDIRIRREIRKLIRKYKTRDPFEIARARGIQIRYVRTQVQKAWSAEIQRNYFIFINPDQSEQMQRCSCAHELAHIVLHRAYFKQRRLMNMSRPDENSQTESEANLFAALLLIDEEELMECLRQGMDLVSAASCLNTNVNFVARMLLSLQRAGAPVEVPFTPDSRFLGRIEDRADSL